MSTSSYPMPSRSSCILRRRQNPHQLVVYIVICATARCNASGVPDSVLDVAEAMTRAADRLLTQHGEHLPASVGHHRRVHE